MNSICLLGRLTAPPELKTTTGGTPVTSFTLAVDRRCAQKGQERVTDFITCVAWRHTAEFITRYFNKGDRMAVAGSLQTRSYEARDGSRRTLYEVVVDNAFFCSAKGAGATVVAEEEVYQPGGVMQNVEAFIDVAEDELLPI